MPVNHTINITSMPNEVWAAVGGAMLVLLQSILSGVRRVWWRLLLSCILGGAGAALAGHIFADSKWVYPICGAAAIMFENIVLGLVKASEEFKDSPIKVFAQLWRLIVPSVFQRPPGEAINDDDTTDAKG